MKNQRYGSKGNMVARMSSRLSRADSHARFSFANNVFGPGIEISAEARSIQSAVDLVNEEYEQLMNLERHTRREDKGSLIPKLNSIIHQAEKSNAEFKITLEKNISLLQNFTAVDEMKKDYHNARNNNPSKRDDFIDFRTESMLLTENLEHPTSNVSSESEPTIFKKTTFNFKRKTNNGDDGNRLGKDGSSGASSIINLRKVVDERAHLRKSNIITRKLKRGTPQSQKSRTNSLLSDVSSKHSKLSRHTPTVFNYKPRRSLVQRVNLLRNTGLSTKSSGANNKSSFKLVTDNVRSSLNARVKNYRRSSVRQSIRDSFTFSVLSFSPKKEFELKNVAPIKSAVEELGSLVEEMRDHFDSLTLAAQPVEVRVLRGGTICGVYDPRSGQVEWRDSFSHGICGVWNPRTQEIEWKEGKKGFSIHGVYNPRKGVVEWNTMYKGGVYGVFNPVSKRVEWKQSYREGVCGTWNPIFDIVEFRTFRNGSILGFYDSKLQRTVWEKKKHLGACMLRKVDTDDGISYESVCCSITSWFDVV